MLPVTHPSRVGATGLASQSVSLLGFRYPAVRFTQCAPSGLVSLAVAPKRRDLQCQVSYQTHQLDLQIPNICI
jgi:hypothetical protein